MKKLSLKTKLFYLLFGFIILFLIRLTYGYMVYPDGESRISNFTQNVSQSSFQLERKNYASSKVAYKTKGMGQQTTTTVDQKYEKVGTLKNLTEAYKDDEKKLYKLIKQQQLMIQLEQKSGRAYGRQLNIALGVVPDKFDNIIKMLREIGNLKHIQIDKKDKTNEYKKLEAERVSLQKARESLLELKQTEGSVGDKITLVNRLLDIENQIQALGVNLGEFDVQNEFCTVKFTLQEVGKAKPISRIHRITVALTWALKYYIAFWIIVVFGLTALWLLLIIIAKGKVIFK
ncbi:MAG: DUF4349 domain-containing protein [Cocleimonas sp.]|nr:DUF4349 domain-containing protein [Cocleimonas sp.]